jgi:ribosome-binding factor A
MGERREARYKEELMRLASRYIEQVSNRQSLITVTNAAVSSDLKNVTIYVSVYPDAQEDTALSFLKRNKKEFLYFLTEKGRFGRLPSIKFALDKGEKHRQRIDELLRDE